MYIDNIRKKNEQKNSFKYLLNCLVKHSENQLNEKKNNIKSDQRQKQREK